jgi:hypothetical protein
LSIDDAPSSTQDPVVQHLRQRLEQIAEDTFSAEEFHRLADQGADEARQVAVEMEFLSGLDTPKDDQKLRMDYQVQRLAKRMGERQHQPDLASEASDLQVRWFRSLPHPPERHENLKKRFRRAQEIIDGMIGPG